jgi:hypothetical protein
MSKMRRAGSNPLESPSIDDLVGAPPLKPKPPAPAADHPPDTVYRKRRREQPRWEDTHKRYSFHCPVDVIKALKREAKKSERSHSEVVVDALVQALKLSGGA